MIMKPQSNMEPLTLTSTLCLGVNKPTREELVEVAERYNITKCDTFIFMGQWFAKITYPNPAINNQGGR